MSHHYPNYRCRCGSLTAGQCEPLLKWSNAFNGDWLGNFTGSKEKEKVSLLRVQVEVLGWLSISPHALYLPFVSKAALLLTV